ncbi:hypothetical protein V8J88_03250 [Massilia sp. W12]|uniref:hypothetical protein n=1 Tax=Massilia sp. W12 TaxID=3126507 RepID=UPI0030CCE2C1
MLIRLANDALVEYPDELGILVLADPSQGDVPDFTLEELNCLISGALGMLYDESATLQQNIHAAQIHFSKWGIASPANLEKARTLLEVYKQIAPQNIGYSDLQLIKSAYGILSPAELQRHRMLELSPAPAQLEGVNKAS